MASGARGGLIPDQGAGAAGAPPPSRIAASQRSFCALSWPLPAPPPSRPPPPLPLLAHAAPSACRVSRSQQQAAPAAQAGGYTLAEVAEYNIILWMSIILVFVFYFAAMALVNMDVTNDSLLYSKSKSD